MCDGQWHHYAVSMESSDVQLYVDGHPLTGSKSHPEIIDDWPLHSSHGLTTILTVGACWQGIPSKFFFIAIMDESIIIINNNLQDQRVA